ncbi:protein SMG7 [Fistulifera solaris]|uniref:Protein SMG7 n=1 Tax=Fistulifera solaris TaxID=1519565 RepID=A0A1Z5KL60_FISSO|nr:protein SMG7 [Fistulifera solaris]|eukprot:GAX27053.1 protein SMG7 [Fistulifera solaris]
MKVSREEYLEKRHDDSLKFEARLKQLKSNDKAAMQLRIKVCEYLTDLILTDPRFACEYGIVDRLWRLCFYDRIRALRASRDKLKRRGEDFESDEKAFVKTLSEAISLYKFMIESLEDKLMKAYPAVSGTQASEEEESDDDDTDRPRASKSPAGIMKCLISMIVQLGDLYRYCGDTRKAQEAYYRAIQLGPGIGHAMNQLAVVLSQADPTGQCLITLYWYARSISVTTDPFMTSAKNLARLFESNQEWLNQHETQQQLSASSNPKSASSKYFLAKFCELHSIFFNGFLPEEIPEVGILQHMEDCRTFFTKLLQNSALGDSLLCKLVTIHAFSETLAERARSGSVANSHAMMQATAWACRVSTLWLGTALVQRVLGAFGNKGQEQKKTHSSYRCLVPMMIVAEYVSTRPIPEWKSFDDDCPGPNLVTLHTEAEKEFWIAIVDVLNHILMQSSSYSGQESMTETALLLKEYLELRGFLPFAMFAPELSSWGRLSDEDAIRELCSLRKGKGKAQESASTLTSGASVQSNADNADQNRIKVLRLLALGRKWADDQDSAFARPIQFDAERNVYIHTESNDREGGSDDGMLLCNDDEFDNTANGVDDQAAPIAMEALNTPVVYHKSSDDGPELLLPWYLLGQKGQGSVSRIAPMDASDADPVIEKPSNLPRPPLRQLEHVDPLASSNLRVAVVNPPPGFGGLTTQGSALSLNQNTDVYGSSHRLYDSVSSHAHSVHQAPLSRLFGDVYMQTTNPFADTHHPSTSASHEAPHYGTTRHSIHGDDLFGHDDGFGAHEASLLDSGLWMSIFKDDPPPPTANPFAT